MKTFNESKDISDKIKLRKLYIDLFSEIIQQPEEFCGNKIKTTRYTM
jgi:hypothetical protein